MIATDLREGMKVRSADGTSLGKIIQIAGSTLVIEKGFFFPKDYTCDLGYVSEIRDGEVWLSTRDDVLRSAESGAIGTTTTAAPSATGWTEGRATARENEDVRVPLAEEELTAEKRMRDAGEVRVRKEVVTEHKTIDVPVTREEVHVERVPVSASSADVAKDAFQEKTISVPVHEEEVELKKRARVKEEVRVTKSRQQVEQRASGEVRHEEAQIDDSTVRKDRTTDRGWSAPKKDEDL